MAKTNVLYLFGGEKALGAEIVIERLITFNAEAVNAHLFISPGAFADQLLIDKKPYKITLVKELKKLNRSTASGLKFIFKAIANYILISRKVYLYIRDHHIEMVHANTLVPASYIIPLIIYSKLLGRKTKWLWSDHDLVYFSRLENNVLSKLCVKLYDRTLAVSYAVKDKYRSKQKVVVLYNGLDTSLFTPDIPLRQHFRGQYHLTTEVVIGMPAVVAPRKGQVELIKVFEKLQDRFFNTKLIFAGTFGSDSADYNKDFCDLLKQSLNVLHVGHQKEMALFYNGCDIIINNTNKATAEPLGTTIYEAMACEKIVLASDTGGTSEIIADHIDGFLFEPENAAALLKSLTYTLENYTTLHTITKRARQKVIDKFNIALMAKNYNQILHSL